MHTISHNTLQKLNAFFAKRPLKKIAHLNLTRSLNNLAERLREGERGHDTKRIIEVHGTLTMTVKGLEYIQQNYKGHCWAVARAPIFHKNQIELERHSPLFQ